MLYNLWFAIFAFLNDLLGTSSFFRILPSLSTRAIVFLAVMREDFISTMMVGHQSTSGGLHTKLFCFTFLCRPKFLLLYLSFAWLLILLILVHQNKEINSLTMIKREKVPPNPCTGTVQGLFNTSKHFFSVQYLSKLFFVYWMIKLRDSIHDQNRESMDN